MTIRCPACLDTGAVTTPDLLLDACPLCCERAAAEWDALDIVIPPRPAVRPPPTYPGGTVPVRRSRRTKTAFPFARKVG